MLIKLGPICYSMAASISHCDLRAIKEVYGRKTFTGLTFDIWYRKERKKGGGGVTVKIASVISFAIYLICFGLS